MIWIVIVNDRYYPLKGTEDWQLVTDDEQEAREYFDQCKPDDYSYAFLVCIEPGKSYHTELAK